MIPTETLHARTSGVERTRASHRSQTASLLRAALVCSAIACPTSVAHSGEDPAHEAVQPAPIPEPGHVTTTRASHGVYVQYVPKRAPLRILALIHGTIAEKGGDGVAEAESFVRLFQEEADARRLLLIAPAFDDANFGGYAGPGGGFRGLFGREIGADEFLNQIVDATLAAHPRLEHPIELLGHSAGGQFVSRYLVMHPQRVRRAVISSAGTFAFPDADFPWAEGMAPLKRSWTWGPGPEKVVSVTPDPQGWLAAAQLPVTVIAAENDEVGVPTVAGQRGATVAERSRLWVDAMNDYAKAHGQPGRVRYRLIPNAHHSMKTLFPACRQALRER